MLTTVLTNYQFDKLFDREWAIAHLLSPSVLAVVAEKIDLVTESYPLSINLHDISPRTERSDKSPVCLSIPTQQIFKENIRWAQFSSLSYSTGDDIHQTFQRSGETDVIPIQFELVSGTTYALFVTRRHLLQTFYEHASTKDDGVTSLFIPYDKWSLKGTRWIRGETLDIYSTYASQVICITHSQDLEPYSGETTLKDAPTLDDNDPHFVTEQYIAILDFDTRASVSNKMTTSDMNEEMGSEAYLDKGMPVRLKVLGRTTSLVRNVVITRDHIIVARVCVSSRFSRLFTEQPFHRDEKRQFTPSNPCRF